MDAKPKPVCKATTSPANTKVLSTTFDKKPNAMPMINCCATNRKVPTENTSAAGIGTGGITGIIIRVKNNVSSALVVGGTLLALNPTIEANNPEMRINGNSKSAKYCMIVVVAISKVLTLSLKK
jgi:hypothetical protein